jgi:tetratricopeptide (TPR) repeat protein
MSRLSILPLLLVFLLSGCAQQQVVAAPDLPESVPQKPGAATDKPAAATQKPEEAAPGADKQDSSAGPKVADEEAKLPAVELTDDLLFEFLISEVAAQRGMLGLAKEGYLDLARKTRDPRVVRRAAEIALYSRDQVVALELSRLWLELEPDSPRALQTLVVMLIAQGQVEEAAPYLEKMLSGQYLDDGFMQLPALFAKTRDVQAVYKVVGSLAQKHPDLPEARYALAYAALQAGHEDEALKELKKAESLKPGWEPSALLHAQLLLKSSRSEGLDFLKRFLDTYPGAQDVRLAYARLLVAANQLNEAHKQFALLATELPNSSEISMAAGLLSLQMGKLEDAEKYLSQTLELGQEDGGVVRYYLGQVAEERKDYDLAENRYLSINEGEYLVASRTRLATMKARQGKLDEARAVLKAVKPSNDVQEVQLVQAEADLMRQAKDYEGVYALLDAAVKARPDQVDLLYDHAMAAERLNKLDVVEADLRKVIKLKPDYAHAYNALGYTLAEKTDRLNEATELLDKAISLSPEDPFILDSMGWLYYRKGNLDKAREFLDRAWRIRQDPEIAAHLGEVLWMKGSRDEASRLWKSSLQSNPKNEVLIEILKKYQP